MTLSIVNIESMPSAQYIRHKKENTRGDGWWWCTQLWGILYVSNLCETSHETNQNLSFGSSLSFWIFVFLDFSSEEWIIELCNEIKNIMNFTD